MVNMISANKDYTIYDIENLTYDQAKEMAIETLNIKGHDCFLVDFGGYFGKSILVFKNKRHIHYANDYELHNEWLVKEKGNEALKEYYIKKLNEILFTEDELLEHIKDYDEYTRKDHFIRDYWIMRYDYLSIFGIGDEAQREFDRQKKFYPFYDQFSFCYVKSEEIINEQAKYMSNIENEYRKFREDLDKFREMISYELANHEACITGEADDTLDALGYRWSDLTNKQVEIVKEELQKQVDSYYL